MVPERKVAHKGLETHDAVKCVTQRSFMRNDAVLTVPHSSSMEGPTNVSYVFEPATIRAAWTKSIIIRLVVPRWEFFQKVSLKHILKVIRKALEIH